MEQAPARTCRPVERGAHAGAGLLAGLVTPWGPTLKQPVPEGLHPVEGTHTGAVREELQPVGRTHFGEVCGELSPVRGTSTLGQGKSVRSPPPEEEGVAETTRGELTTDPIPCPPALLGRGRGRETGLKLSLGRREGWGEGVLKSSFIFSLSYSDLIVDELNSLFSSSSICFVCDSNW